MSAQITETRLLPPHDWPEFITLEVPMSLPSRANSDGQRGQGWRDRARLVKRQREVVHDALDIRRPPTRGPVTVELVRVSPRHLDPSNNVHALKAVQDEVALWLGYSDDNHPDLRWRYGQATDGRPRYQAARITIVVGHHNCERCGQALTYPEETRA